MAHSVDWLPESLDDVDEIAAFIAKDSRAYASAMVQRFINAARGLPDYPLKGRVVPEWNEESIREILIGSYRMIYRVDDRSVLIIAVIHGARLLPDRLQDR